MKQIPLLALTVLHFFSCTKKGEAPLEKAAIYFNTVPADSSGIHFSNQLYHKSDLNIIDYLYYYNGGGVAIGDINNDGLEDIYMTANQGPDKLYLNLGNLKFKDISKTSNIIIDSTWSSGVTMEDVNNDGLLDIYVSKVNRQKTKSNHNLLYINQGDNSFEESSERYGLNFSGLSTQASFFDYDNDGDMDVYLMNHSVHSVKSYGDIGKRNQTDSLSGDRLYENKLNDGLTTFTDATSDAAIYSSALGYGLALTTADVNDDGYIDIYVGNDFHENDYLYINQGNKTFKESSEEFLTHSSRFTMGVDIADIDNDLKADIFSLDMMPFDKEIFLKSAGEDSDKITQIKKNHGFGNQYARNTFQLNRDNNSFAEIALMSNTYASDWSWSSLIQDYDNDGYNDIYVTNGIYKRPNDLNYINYISTIDFAKYNTTKQDEIEKRLIEKMPMVHIPNVMYRNQGNFEFSQLSPTAGLNPSYSNGAAYSDLDNDGDLDLVVNNINQKAFLLENKSKRDAATNYASFSIEGDTIFKNPSGAKVYLYSEDKTFVKQLNATKGFQSSSTHKIHFGLGNSSKIDSVKILWLDGKSQLIKELSINEHYTLKREEENLKVAPVSITNSTPEPEIFPFYHIENNYLDYETEKLMPEKLSTEGPAVVQADFNGDGLQDVFIGGARYQAPSLFMQQKDGSYIEDKTSGLSKDTIYEDTDATSFDMDNDGDLDLYVMSGGNDRTEENPHLEDRIYVNDGNAKFTRLKASLIKTNGGSVSSADFDGDGFVDLFIGNRSIPGGYGLSPTSYILKNDGTGRFGILQQEAIGMVTDSEWADLNNDQLLDLIIVGDWMPVTVLINQGNSKFLNQTKKYGLENTQGMWNSVTISDLDQNGFNDIIVGNAGLNFKWKASQEKPVLLYVDDFDNNKQSDPIIFYDFFGSYIPFASRDKLSEQLPSLKKKFSNYQEFATVNSVEALTGKKEADILEKKKITELRSMVYFNSGSNFKGAPLPKTAQMSSIEDIYVLDSEGIKDIYYVGNFLGYINELGQSDANSGGHISVDHHGKTISKGSLALPKTLNARKIIKLENGSFLVVSNNDKSYLLKREPK
ncbi:VCBS repeat-containing protein [Zobellia nedashkovskayae]|uniref:VCBS repeat-containing protein n=1 Tax=Zobellia nedashkovskayae TaxID=2779510 RepID=UPI00188C279D|nr:VCBS repeat-containing protein [Zobellia nedashkovskayae]